MSRTRQAKRRFAKLIDTTIPRNVERALTAIATVVGNRATLWTPIDTQNLNRSQDREVRKFNSGWRATIVYTVDYAAALHERDDWKPKPPGSPGKPNGGWNPNAESDWMTKANEETRAVQERIITGELKL